MALQPPEIAASWRQLNANLAAVDRLLPAVDVKMQSLTGDSVSPHAYGIAIRQRARIVQEVAELHGLDELELNRRVNDLLTRSTDLRLTIEALDRGQVRSEWVNHYMGYTQDHDPDEDLVVPPVPEAVPTTPPAARPQRREVLALVAALLSTGGSLLIYLGLAIIVLVFAIRITFG